MDEFIVIALSTAGFCLAGFLVVYVHSWYIDTIGRIKKP